MTAAGVTRDARVARVTTGIATSVAFFSLVILGDLDSLLEMLQFDADDSVVGYAVDRSGGPVVGRDAVSVTMGRRDGLVGLVLNLVLKDDGLDLLEQMGVYTVALGFLVSDRHRGVVSPAAERRVSSDDDGRRSGVAVPDRRLGGHAADQSEGDLHNKHSN